MENEITLLKKCKNENIVKLIDYKKTDSKLFLILEVKYLIDFSIANII